VSNVKEWLSQDNKIAQSDDVQYGHQLEVKSGLKSAIVIETETNFYRYLISKSLLLSNNEIVDSTPPDNRILLDIELAPALVRQAEKEENQDLFNVLQAQFFQDVETRVENCLAVMDDDVYQQYKIAPNLMDAMNMFNTKTVSISRIKPLILKQAALVKNMVNVLNRFDAIKKSNDKPLQTTDADLCIGYLGIEKLRIFLSYLIVHETLKETGSKFNQTSRKLWTHIQVTAQAASELAILDGTLDPDEIYMLALFHEIGSVFLLHIVDDCFHEAKREISEMAMDSGASELSHKLAEINSVAPVLEKLMPNKVKALSFKLASRYNMNSFKLAPILDELANTVSIDGMSDKARVIAQARSYAIFKQMYKEELIDKRQSTELLNYYQLDSNALKTLNKVKYLKVPKVEV